jgi:hypothetical protein
MVAGNLQDSDTVVSLNFAGSSVDSELITRELQVAPDSCSAHSWKLSSISSSWDSTECGTYKEWKKFLRNRTEAFKNLAKLGHNGYVEIQIRVPFNAGENFSEHFKDSVFLDSSFLKLLARLNLSVSVWYRKQPLPNASSGVLSILSELEIPQPNVFFHKTDEDNFFAWLSSIPAIEKVTGRSLSLFLHLKESPMDDFSLRSLIALMTRYQIDVSCLQSQVTETNSNWLQASSRPSHRNVYPSEH